MEGPPVKRFKPLQNATVLTLDSDSDSDSDDDIVITGIRQVSNPQPQGGFKHTPQKQLPLGANGASASKTASPAITSALGGNASSIKQQPTHLATPQSTPAHNLTGATRVQQLAQPAIDLAAKGAVATPPASQVKVAPATQATAPKTEVKAEQARRKGLIQHQTGALELNGHFFKSTADIAAREKELQNRIGKYKKAMEVLEIRKKKRPEKQVQLKAHKDRLLKIGTPLDNPKIVEITKEMQKLSQDTRDHAKKEMEMKVGFEKSTAKLNNFIKNDKPHLVQIIQKNEQILREKRLLLMQQQQKAEQERREKKAQQEQERIRIYEQQIAAIQAEGALNGRGMNAQAYMQRALEAARQLMNRDAVAAAAPIPPAQPQDTDPYYLRRIREMEERQRQRDNLARNQASLNRYTTDADDLIHLLESVKKQEEQEIEGESNTPDELLINLLKHQRIGLKWMEDSEDDRKKRGGILADAMGLGKTVQMIALIMSHRAEKNEDEDATRYGKTNLIVAPVSLINQWKGEVETKVKEATGVKIFMYHSLGNRKVTYDQLKEYDIVMTSYGTLSSELSKHCRISNAGDEFNLKTPPNLTKINQIKGDEGYISPFFGDESLFYRIVLDEAQQIKNKFTKVSVSCASLNSYYRWCLSGTPMQNNVEELYPLLRFLNIRPYNIEGKFREDISNRLKVDNRRFDEYDKEAAIKKLRILLRSVMLRREKDSTIDGKPILDLPKKSVVIENTLLNSNKNEETFYRSIEESSAAKVKKILNGPIAKGDYSYIFVLLLRLRQACLHSELVRIGDRKKGVRYDDDGNVISTATVESMCKNAEKYRPEVVRRINEASEAGMTCPICHEDPPVEDLVLFYPCGHGLCKECCEQFFENFQEGGNENVRVSKCTTCRMQVKENELVDYEVFDKRVLKNQSVNMIKLVYDEKKKNIKDAQEDLNNLKVENLEFSPKIADTISLVRKIWSDDTDDKIIIFSHFTSFFSILKKFLRREGIDCLEYLGSMNANARDEVVKEFYRNPEKKLMLISLKAGNSGLTLTCANHVIIMDPFWNPYVEAQAQDRCHRIGQQKPVTVHRMLIKDTVEDRILTLQENKKSLIESALDPTGMKEASRLSRKDIANLFGIRDDQLA